MTLRIVTTYNPAHWGVYVQRNLRSWLEHIDAEIVVYHEGPRSPLERERIGWRQWEEIPGAQDFIDECAAFPAARGRFGGAYDYNYDAHKFSRKVWAWLDAAEEPGDYLMWLDSDVEALAPFGVPLIQELMMGMAMATYQRPGYHSETGVVIWDLDRCETLFRGLGALYRNRRVFCLDKGWHDCWALDFAIAQIGLTVANLTRDRREYGPHTDLEVVSKSDFGRYIRHDKGARKHA